jgi:adenine-specific DNA-methyltransferase
MSIDKINVGDNLTQSIDIVSKNISKIKELFPEVLTEGKIDFKVLQDILGNEVVEEEEFYRFTWAGKSQARREAHKPSTGSLRPCKEESVDWDTTQNLYIEGDNLEVLKLLQKSYSNKVKMIYIDPPYNTGKDFVYKDNYKDNLKNYQQITGQVDSEGNKMSTNAESDGRYHSNWLNMMYPRLKLARNLLLDDGVIFISIDYNEYQNLIKLTEEIFGENQCETIIWRKSGIGRDGKMKNTSTSRNDHEYIVCCFKSLKILNKSYEIPNFENEYGNPDNDLRGPYKSGSISRKEEASNPNHKWYYKVISPSGKYFERQFEISKEDFNKLNEDKRIYWGKQGDAVPSIKIFTNEKREITTSSIIDNKKITTTIGSKELEEILDIPGIGEEMRPKPLELLLKLIQIGTYEDSLILDFFSGSSTTACALLKFNQENYGSKRKFIMVQLPERTDEDSVSYKKGYKRISEFGMERIRRTGKIILNEQSSKIANLKNDTSLFSEEEELTKSDVKFDIGFKVFKLDSSNIKGWDGLPDNLENSLFESQDNIKSDRKEEDVLFEILLKYGLDLTLPIEEKVIEGKKVFNVGFGALFICLGNELTSKVAEGIGQWKETLKPETCRVIFKDGGFTDVEKTNSVQTLKRFGIQEIKSI